MLKRKIQSIIGAFIIIGSFSTSVFALNSDDVLKFLIESAYPETNSNKKSEESSKEDTSGSNKKPNNEENDDYLKFHVGEGNIPQIESNEDVAKGQTSTSAFNASEYINDNKITKDKPNILLYHTHATESYADNPEGNYHITDKTKTVVSLGSIITESLTKKGWGVLHNVTAHDYPNYNASYSNSLKTLKNIKAQYSSINMSIDIHRDAYDFKTDEIKNGYKKKYSTTVNGKSVAKFFFVIGPDNENFNELKALADGITKYAESKYPGITLPTIIKKKGKYNQYVFDKGMLVEFGCNANTLAQAQESARLFAEIIDGYYNQ